MTYSARDRLGQLRRLLVGLAMLATLSPTAASAQAREGGFLGLMADPGTAPNFWEGRTNYRLFVRPKGTIRAIMLFARFPDAEAEESTQDLFKRLEPESMAFFEKASYGQMTLTMDARHRWIPMDQASTWEGYNGKKWATHKAYIAEVVRKVGDVDFSKFEVVYIIGSKNKGTPISPTWRAFPGDGIKVGNIEVRHAITLGNDMRNANWGWQTLAHEMGHVFGLPDLYSFGWTPGSGPYKDLHKHVGFWDVMSWQAAGSEYLAWHKYKLGWLDDSNFVVAKNGSRSALVTPIDEKGGLKGVVVPIRPSEAYVVEVRSRDGKPGSETGVLCYKVSLTITNGEGPIQVIPAKPDDGNPALEKRFVTLYNALSHEGTVLEEKSRGIKVEIQGREGRSYRIRVSR
jgi:M6 family metalloprotease-like protein